MPAPYSNDLREKAMAAVRRGEKKIEVCRMLKISRNTLDLWVKRVEKTGNCRPEEAKNKGTPPKIKELQKFRDFVLKHQEKTQKQIAELWGEGLTQQNVSDACRKLGITRKKKRMDTEKEMSNKEPNLSKNSKPFM